jgi:hypothetical protein
LTARGGKGFGGTPPPLPAVRSSNGGRTRWRHPRPGARRCRWLLQTRESGGKKGCLGGSWGRCGFDGVLGGAFYRPERAVQKVAGASVWRRATGKAGCGGLGSVLAGCGHGVWALWACVGELTPVGIVLRGRGQGEGVRAVSSLSSMSHAPGQDRGGWGSTTR